MFPVTYSQVRCGRVAVNFQFLLELGSQNAFDVDCDLSGAFSSDMEHSYQ